MTFKFVPPSKEELAARGVGAEKPAAAAKQTKPTEKKPAVDKAKE